MGFFSTPTNYLARKAIKFFLNRFLGRYVVGNRFHDDQLESDITNGTLITVREIALNRETFVEIFERELGICQFGDGSVRKLTVEVLSLLEGRLRCELQGIQITLLLAPPVPPSDESNSQPGNGSKKMESSLENRISQSLLDPSLSKSVLIGDYSSFIDEMETPSPVSSPQIESESNVSEVAAKGAVKELIDVLLNRFSASLRDVDIFFVTPGTDTKDPCVFTIHIDSFEFHDEHSDLSPSSLEKMIQVGPISIRKREVFDFFSSSILSPLSRSESDLSTSGNSSESSSFSSEEDTATNGSKSESLILSCIDPISLHLSLRSGPQLSISGSLPHVYVWLSPGDLCDILGVVDALQELFPSGQMQGESATDRPPARRSADDSVLPSSSFHGHPLSAKQRSRDSQIESCLQSARTSAMPSDSWFLHVQFSCPSLRIQLLFNRNQPRVTSDDSLEDGLLVIVDEIRFTWMSAGEFRSEGSHFQIRARYFDMWSCRSSNFADISYALHAEVHDPDPLLNTSDIFSRLQQETPPSSEKSKMLLMSSRTNDLGVPVTEARGFEFDSRSKFAHSSVGELRFSTLHFCVDMIFILPLTDYLRIAFSSLVSSEDSDSQAPFSEIKGEHSLSSSVFPHDQSLPSRWTMLDEDSSQSASEFSLPIPHLAQSVIEGKIDISRFRRSFGRRRKKLVVFRDNADRLDDIAEEEDLHGVRNPESQTFLVFVEQLSVKVFLPHIDDAGLCSWKTYQDDSLSVVCSDVEFSRYSSTDSSFSDMVIEMSSIEMYQTYSEAADVPIRIFHCSGLKESSSSSKALHIVIRSSDYTLLDESRKRFHRYSEESWFRQYIRKQSSAAVDIDDKEDSVDGVSKPGRQQGERMFGSPISDALRRESLCISLAPLVMSVRVGESTAILSSPRLQLLMFQLETFSTILLSCLDASPLFPVASSETSSTHPLALNFSMIGGRPSLLVRSALPDNFLRLSFDKLSLHLSDSEAWLSGEYPIAEAQEAIAAVNRIFDPSQHLLSIRYADLTDRGKLLLGPRKFHLELNQVTTTVFSWSTMSIAKVTNRYDMSVFELDIRAEDVSLEDRLLDGSQDFVVGSHPCLQAPLLPVHHHHALICNILLSSSSAMKMTHTHIEAKRLLLEHYVAPSISSSPLLRFLDLLNSGSRSAALHPALSFIPQELRDSLGSSLLDSLCGSVHSTTSSCNADTMNESLTDVSSMQEPSARYVSSSRIVQNVSVQKLSRVDVFLSNCAIDYLPRTSDAPARAVLPFESFQLSTQISSQSQATDVLLKFSDLELFLVPSRSLRPRLFESSLRRIFRDARINESTHQLHFRQLLAQIKLLPLAHSPVSRMRIRSEQTPVIKNRGFFSIECSDGHISFSLSPDAVAYLIVLFQHYMELSDILVDFSPVERRVRRLARIKEIREQERPFLQSRVEDISQSILQALSRSLPPPVLVSSSSKPRVANILSQLHEDYLSVKRQEQETSHSISRLSISSLEDSSSSSVSQENTPIAATHSVSSTSLLPPSSSSAFDLPASCSSSILLETTEDSEFFDVETYEEIVSDPLFVRSSSPSHDVLRRDCRAGTPPSSQRSLGKDQFSPSSGLKHSNMQLSPSYTSLSYSQLPSTDFTIESSASTFHEHRNRRDHLERSVWNDRNSKVNQSSRCVSNVLPPRVATSSALNLSSRQPEVVREPGWFKMRLIPGYFSRSRSNIPLSDYDIPLKCPMPEFSILLERMSCSVFLYSHSSFKSARVAQHNESSSSEDSHDETRHHIPSIELSLKGVRLRSHIFPLESPRASRLVLGIQDMKIYFSSRDGKVVRLLSEWDAPEELSHSDLFRLVVEAIRPIGESGRDQELRLRIAEVAPLRLRLSQSLFDFLRDFATVFCLHSEFGSSQERESNREDDWEVLDALGPHIQSVYLPPIRIKLNYEPRGINFSALREGDFIEFASLVPPLRDVQLSFPRYRNPHQFDGWGSLMESLSSMWLSHLLHNERISIFSGVPGIGTLVRLSDGIKDFVLLPMAGYQKSGKKGLAFGLLRGAESMFRVLATESASTIFSLSCAARNILHPECLLENAEPRDAEHHPPSHLRSIRSTPSTGRILRTPLPPPRSFMDALNQSLSRMWSEIQAGGQQLRIAFHNDDPSSKGALRHFGEASLIRIPSALLSPLRALFSGVGTIAEGIYNGMQDPRDIRESQEERLEILNREMHFDHQHEGE